MCGASPWGASCRISSRKSNLSSIAFELCCQTMLSMLFNNSLMPCIQRLAFNNWKVGNVLGREASGGTRGQSRGIGVDHMI